LECGDLSPLFLVYVMVIPERELSGA
jgi:hypothetical protein